MNRTMIRLGGMAAVLGGLYLLILSILQAFGGSDLDEGGFFWQTIPFMPIFLTLGAAGLLTLADGHNGLRIGAGIIGLGTALMAIGFAMMVWLNNDNGWSVMFGGMILHPIGFLLFGLTNWRDHLLRRWNGLPLIVGVICCLLLALTLIAEDTVGLTEQQSQLAFAAYLLTLAVGWAMLGADLLVARGNKAVSAAAAT